VGREKKEHLLCILGGKKISGFHGTLGLAQGRGVFPRTIREREEDAPSFSK